MAADQLHWSACPIAAIVCKQALLTRQSSSCMGSPVHAVSSMYQTAQAVDMRMQHQMHAMQCRVCVRVSMLAACQRCHALRKSADVAAY